MIDIRVRYPADIEIALRCGLDWSRDVLPVRLERDGTERVFEIEPPAERPQVYFKAVRRSPGRTDWSVGSNYLAVPGVQRIYPHFDGGLAGRITDKLVLGGGRSARVFLPPGYDDNVLKRYPVLYALDGANVFFPEEAFSGQDWEMDETLDQLNAMNLVDKVIVVALYSDPDARADEYTRPGYDALGAELVEHVVPDVDARWRTLRGGPHTAVIGASLGGVAALALAWNHPRQFGMAACLSSTFGHKDDLLARIWSELRRDIRVYLDSGWPADNHASTLEVYDALVARGWTPGSDALFLGFPGALHHERSWAQRFHLPMQFFFGHAFRRRVQARLGDGDG